MEAFFTNGGLQHIGLQIVSHLDSKSVANVRLVNRTCYDLVSETRLWAIAALDLLQMKTQATCPEIWSFWNPFIHLAKRNLSFRTLQTLGHHLKNDIELNQFCDLGDYIELELLVGIEKLVKSEETNLVGQILRWLKDSQILSTEQRLERFDCTSAWILMNGCLLGLPKLVEFILTDPLQENVNVNQMDKDHTPAIIFASKFHKRYYNISKAEVLALLLKAPEIDVNVTFEDYYGEFNQFMEIETALHYSASGGDAEAIKELISHKDIDVNIRDHAGWTPLYRILSKNYRTGRTPEARAESERVRIRGLSFLLKHPSINVNVADSDGWTPLHRAILIGCIEDVSMLLKAGANINARDISGVTPLHIIMEDREGCKVDCQEVEKLQLLLQHEDIDVNAAAEKGNTPLHHACYNRVKIQVLQTLLGASGINVNVTDARGNTPMDLCRRQEWTEGIAVFNELHFPK